MESSEAKSNGFLADGYEHARRGNEPVVRAAVEKEFAAELEIASVWQRSIIRRRMQREIERRLDRLAPPDALY